MKKWIYNNSIDGRVKVVTIINESFVSYMRNLEVEKMKKGKNEVGRVAVNKKLSDRDANNQTFCLTII